ncbi:MAG: biopolymer transporter ExbD [Pseudomonadota bacterium]
MRRGFRRRALSLTPLVDVIFLLLLFFMLTSTFSRFGEIEVSAAAAGDGGGAVTDTRFLQLTEEGVRLAGRTVEAEALPELLEGERVLVALGPSVTAQQLVDLLGVLRGVPGLSLTVLR